jgi:hypothetical protein
MDVCVFDRRRGSGDTKSEESCERQREERSPGASADRTKTEGRDEYWADIRPPVQEGDRTTTMAVIRIDVRTHRALERQRDRIRDGGGDCSGHAEDHYPPRARGEGEEQD